jgi:hypothetical protein
MSLPDGRALGLRALRFDPGPLLLELPSTVACGRLPKRRTRCAPERRLVVRNPDTGGEGTDRDPKVFDRSFGNDHVDDDEAVWLLSSAVGQQAAERQVRSRLDPTLPGRQPLNDPLVPR